MSLVGGISEGAVTMFRRLAGLPAYSVSQGQVSARRYNQLTLAMKRLKRPLRISVRQLRGLAMVVDDDSWVCVDTSLNDLPIVAWTHFESRGRDNLHEPIDCRISQFHAHAGLVMETALRETVEQITERLRANKG